MKTLTNIIFIIELTIINYGFALTLLLYPIVVIGYNWVNVLDKYSYQEIHAQSKLQANISQ